MTRPKIFGIAGWKNSGKTGLAVRLVTELVARGYRVSTIKHAHHDFDIDHPGKDSWRHRAAGCGEVLVSSGRRWALMHELRGAPEATLDELLSRLSPCDLVLVEGFKQASIPRIEVYRPALGKPPLHTEDPGFLAVVTDAPQGIALPCLPLNEPARVADFLCRTLGLG